MIKEFEIIQKGEGLPIRSVGKYAFMIDLHRYLTYNEIDLGVAYFIFCFNVLMRYPQIG